MPGQRTPRVALLQISQKIRPVTKPDEVNKGNASDDGESRSLHLWPSHTVLPITSDQFSSDEAASIRCRQSESTKSGK
jgi:hypothetical protein